MIKWIVDYAEYIAIGGLVVALIAQLVALYYNYQAGKYYKAMSDPGLFKNFPSIHDREDGSVVIDLRPPKD